MRKTAASGEVQQFRDTLRNSFVHTVTYWSYWSKYYRHFGRAIWILEVFWMLFVSRCFQVYYCQQGYWSFFACHCNLPMYL